MNVLKTERLGNGNLLVTVPVTFKWRNVGNGRVIINPNGALVDQRREAILLAVARGRRWIQLLDEGSVGSIREIAAKIGREASYVARVIRLSLLAPIIIESVIKGEYPDGFSTNSARKALPELWKDQIEQFMS